MVRVAVQVRVAAQIRMAAQVWVAGQVRMAAQRLGWGCGSGGGGVWIAAQVWVRRRRGIGAGDRVAALWFGWRDYLLSQLLPARDGAGGEVSLGSLGSQVRPESRKAARA